MLCYFKPPKINCIIFLKLKNNLASNFWVICNPVRRETSKEKNLKFDFPTFFWKLIDFILKMWEGGGFMTSNTPGGATGNKMASIWNNFWPQLCSWTSEKLIYLKRSNFIICQELPAAKARAAEPKEPELRIWCPCQSVKWWHALAKRESNWR